MALCCSAAFNVMTSLIVDVTYVGNALACNDVPDSQYIVHVERRLAQISVASSKQRRMPELYSRRQNCTEFARYYVTKNKESDEV